MRVTVDTKEIEVHIKGLNKMTPTSKNKLWTSLKSTSIKLKDRVKDLMPVRTGRAASSWGIWSNLMIMPNPDASKADAIWTEDKDKLETTQGSNVPYIGALNAGHSQQRPAGFIDLANDGAKRMLQDEGERIVKEVKP